MNRIIVGLAALLAIGSAYVSFDVSSKKKQLTIDLQDTQNKLDQTTKTLASTKKELEETQTAKKAAEDQVTSLTGELAALRSKAQGLESDLSATKSQLQTAQQSAKEAQDKLDAYANSFDGKSAEEVKADMDAKEKKIADLSTEIKGLQDKVASLETQVAKFQKEDDQRRRGVTPPGVQGRIVAINAQWNFAVLDIGREAGVVENSELVVVRGTTPVAKCKVATVDEKTAVVDFTGVMNQGSPVVGDYVISGN
jgi:septal ring factor EnvC (AmiA/AmiB activator)